MQKADLVVIGAGPGGSAAAITARRAGLDVIVVDKARFPRDKFCGDGLTAGALRRLEDLGVQPETVPSWKPVRDIELTGPNRHRVEFRLPGDGLFAVITRRRELDASLVEQARDEGADVREGVALKTAAQDDDAVDLSFADGTECRARWVIGADGMWSPLRKLLGAHQPGYRGEWHAFRQYVTKVAPPARDRLHVWFEPDILPGYVWSFPLADGAANIGFGIRRGGVHSIQDMKELWPALLSRPHIAEVLGPDYEPEQPHRAWPIPARVGKLPLSIGRALFVGDAAAVTDPLTGEGIGQALQTGCLAADAIGSLGATSAALAVTKRYEAGVRDDLVADHRLASTLSTIMGSPFGARTAIAIAGRSQWTRDNFARWLFEDYPRAVLATPRRWSRGMLSGSGAYRSKTTPDTPS